MSNQAVNVMERLKAQCFFWKKLYGDADTKILGPSTCVDWADITYPMIDAYVRKKR